MDKLQKKVLQQNTTVLVHHRILSEAFKDELHQAGIFPEPMLAEIMSERTVQQRTSRMLELLPTRGPSAFEKFLQILGNDYWWLQEKMQKSLDNEISEQNKNVSTPNVCNDVDPRSGISSLLHKLFGQSRKVSEKDKRTLEKWMTDAIQQVKTTWKTRLENEVESTSRLQEALEDISSKIDVANFKLEECLYDMLSGEAEATKQTVHKNLSLEDSAAHLDHNINVVRERLLSMAEDQEKCLEAVSLTSNVPVGDNEISPSPRFASMSIYKHVTKMKEEYEQNHRYLEEEKNIEIRELKDELDLLSAEREDLAKQSEQYHSKSVLYMKEMFELQKQKDRMRDYLETREQVIKEQEKKLAKLELHSSSPLRSKYYKPSNYVVNSKEGKAHQLGVPVSQKQKAKPLTKVNKIYLSDKGNGKSG